MNSMKIGTYQMDTTFGLYLPEYTIPAPAVQTNFVKIIGRDGSVDLSNALGLHYDSRTWSLDFKCFDPTVNWHTLSSQVMNAIHGKRLNFEFDDDPDYFWTGRVSVQNYVSNHGTGTLKVTIVSDPFKYAKLSTIVTKTASTGTEYTGSMVTFNDGLIYDLSADIEPIQDLHGYANPWPAGGGKNLVGLNTSPNRVISYTGVSASDHTDDAVTLTSNGNITYAHMGLYYDLPAGTYTLSIKATSSDSFAPVVSGYKLADNTLLFNSCKEGTPKSFTLSETTAVNFRFFATTSDSTARTVTFYDVQLESGSTATSWTPYSNICPISGRTGVDVWDDPKYGGTVAWNQLRPDSIASGTSQGIVLTFDSETGEVELSGTSTTTYRNFFSRGPLTLNHEYALIMDVLKNPNNVSFHLNAFNGVLTGTFSNPSTIAMCRLERETTNFGIEGFTANTVMDGIVLKFNIFDLTQMFGSTIADYIYSLERADAGAGVAWFRNLFPKPYYSYNAGETTCVSAVNGDPYWKKDIDWTSEAGTVYGGTLDVVTGVLTVDKVLYTYTGNEAVSSRSGIYIPVKLGASGIYVNNDEICTDFEHVRVGANGWSYIQTTMTPAEVQTYLQNHTVSIVCELATPLTYQLTPQEIEALVGTNNVWSDGGNVTVAVVTPETLTNNGRAVVPTLTASADMVLKWGNYSASVQQGTSTIPQLILENGANLIYIIGTGSISFTWQEASL